ncbi:MAG: hypothetical protein HYS33_02780 [Acidobacteria bacterium]|nr:hypothetical protein [Acidobacteriota bacterium]
MRDLQWSKAEKAAARRIFDTAYEQESKAIRAELKRMIGNASEPRDIWRIHDYLSAQRRETDRKYDYRYSVLILVFARLFSEGWLTEDDLRGLHRDKIEMIKRAVL